MDMPSMKGTKEWLRGDLLVAKLKSEGLDTYILNKETTKEVTNMMAE